MPSLKDLRGRINSVKSTRKITSAMKMVAASKLRRAQSQAEAARPYAERMEGMLARLAASIAGTPDAPRLLAGTGRDQVAPGGARHRRPRAGRRVQLLHRPRDPHLVRRLEGEGKTVKLLPVGRKGRDYLRREFAANIVGDVSYAGLKRVEFAQARELGERIAAMFERRRVRRLHRGLQPLRLRDLAGAHRDAAHPAAGARAPRGRQRRPARPLRVRARRGGRSWPACCRRTWRSSSTARCWKAAPASRGRA